MASTSPQTPVTHVCPTCGEHRWLLALACGHGSREECAIAAGGGCQTLTTSSAPLLDREHHSHALPAARRSRLHPRLPAPRLLGVLPPGAAQHSNASKTIATTVGILRSHVVTWDANHNRRLSSIKTGRRCGQPEPVMLAWNHSLRVDDRAPRPDTQMRMPGLWKGG